MEQPNDIMSTIVKGVYGFMAANRGEKPEKIIITVKQRAEILTTLPYPDATYKTIMGIPYELSEDLKQKDEIESEAFIKLLDYNNRRTK